MTSTQAEGLSLRQAIIDGSTDDHAPRLVYADWLEEYGDPEDDALLARFIRLQVRMEDLRKDCCCGRCVGRRGRGGQHTNGPCVLEWRENRDLLVEQKVILEDLGGFRAFTYELCYALHEKHVYDLDVRYKKPPCPVGVRFVGGFIQEVSAPMSVLDEWGCAIARLCPLARVTTSDMSPSDMSQRLEHGWGWWSYEDGPESSKPHEDLPTAVWDRLPTPDNQHGRWKWFAGRDAAFGALNAALLAYCKGEKATS